MRSQYADVMPGAMKAMIGLAREVRHSPLDPALLELVKVRVSQLNGCAYCVDTHVRAARARGESDLRLSLLPVWPDAPCYSDRERAALRWSDEVTMITDTHASDAAYAELERLFTEDEIVALTYAIVSINGFNRLSIAFRQPVDEPRAAARSHRQADGPAAIRKAS
jgi:AhpD family alkylhydroperoxidase